MPGIPFEPLTRVSHDDRIVNGDLARLGEFPHHVGIYYNDEVICGGSIISTLLVLSAAHCFFSRKISNFHVVAGQDQANSYGNGEQTRDVKFIFMHPNYNHRTKENDIAILVLSKPLRYTDNVKSIQLPRQSERFDGLAKVCGWGHTKFNGTGSVKLRKISVPLVPNNDCRRRYPASYKITDDMMCIGDGMMDTCQGDSGGGALCRRHHRTMVQCGIVSFGKGCGEKEYPRVYTSVASYVNWIKRVETKILTFPRNDTSVHRIGCIPGTVLCHLEWNCQNNCDAFTTCRRGEFRCNNGHCIKRELTCDGSPDCKDKSDEPYCEKRTERCPGNEHQCGVGGACIPRSKVCNGRNDCGNNSDEENCPVQQLRSVVPACSMDSEFYCDHDFSCIPLSLRCDGVKHCPSGQDELDCQSFGVQQRDATGQKKLEKDRKNDDLLLKLQKEMDELENNLDLAIEHYEIENAYENIRQREEHSKRTK